MFLPQSLARLKVGNVQIVRLEKREMIHGWLGKGGGGFQVAGRTTSEMALMLMLMLMLMWLLGGFGKKKVGVENEGVTRSKPSQACSDSLCSVKERERKKKTKRKKKRNKKTKTQQTTKRKHKQTKTQCTFRTALASKCVVEDKL